MGVLALPETIARATDVPVGQDVGKQAHLFGCRGDIGIGKRRVDIDHDIVGLSQDIAVQNMRGAGVELCFLLCVELQEGIGIPDRQDSLAHALANALLGHDEVASAQDRRGHQEPTHGIRTIAIKDLVDVRIIAL